MIIERRASKPLKEPSPYETTVPVLAAIAVSTIVTWGLLPFPAGANVESPEMTLTDIQAVKVSSKSKHESSFLFVAKVVQFEGKLPTRDFSLEEVVEVFLPRSECYELVRAVFGRPGATLRLKFFQIDFLTAVANRPYTRFLKIGPVADAERSHIECEVSFQETPT